MFSAYVNFVWASPTRQLDIVVAGNETWHRDAQHGIEGDATRRMSSLRKKNS